MSPSSNDFTSSAAPTSGFSCQRLRLDYDMERPDPMMQRPRSQATNGIRVSSGGTSSSCSQKCGSTSYEMDTQRTHTHTHTHTNTLRLLQTLREAQATAESEAKPRSGPTGPALQTAALQLSRAGFSHAFR